MKKWIWWLLAGLLGACLLTFTEFRQRQKRCQSIVVHLDSKAEYPFFTEQDIKELITKNGTDPAEGSLFEHLDLKNLEKRVELNRLVKKCQAYQDLSGNLVVDIQQQEPLARVIQFSDGEQAASSSGNYLTTTGELVPLSGRFAARVVLVSGDFFRDSRQLRGKRGAELIELLKRIRQDSFWRAQLTQLNVEKDGEITMLPQVGQHRIEFGFPDEADAKFEKLKLFYKTILPLKGWDQYQRVSVKFRNQIVCE
jgi:cell division protein FtsQ